MPRDSQEKIMLIWSRPFFSLSKAIAILGISRARRQACRQLAAVGFVTQSKFPEANFSPLATKELAARKITILHVIKIGQCFYFATLWFLFHLVSYVF